MVLFKRKPVQYLPPAEVDNDDAEVWVIRQTKEIFATYEDYLSRMDFYKQRRFICQITGHSGLDFFEALKSELAGAQEVEQAFPEALKGPVLRRVQFQTISRIDTLVDLIYDEFRQDYYPGEAVTVHVISGERITGTVRDKTSFGPKLLADGTMNPPFSRYFVSLDNRPEEEAVVDDAHITRDRKIFTKQVLRSFIKKTVTRESWTGAPWQVKHEVAKLYHIDIRVPPHLRYENKAAERKQKQQQQKAAPEFEGMIGSFPGNVSQKLPELKPAPKSHKSKQQQGQNLAKSKPQPSLNPAPTNTHPPHFIPQPPNYLSHTFQAAGPAAHAGHHPGAPHFAQFHTQQFAFQPLQSMPPAPLPPPPIKYPIDDLQVIPRHELVRRPALKFFSQDTPSDNGKKASKDNGILMKSVGLLLESWDTLSVFCEIMVLDSFTFDDFVDAMQIPFEDVECELYVEIHCAALKMLVSSESDGGKVLVSLPEMEEDDDSDESDGEASAPPSPEPEPESIPPARATRSSMAKAEAEALKVEALSVKDSTPEPKITHRAAEMQAEIGWIDRLRKREFKNGGWELIMVGLLYQLSKSPRYFESCEALLNELAPLDMEPTLDTAREQYAQLNVNARLQALQIVCLLCTETKAVRSYMEECSELMTGFRKEKIQHQRDRKQLLEDLRLLTEERKILLPDNMPPSPAPENKVSSTDIKMSGVDEEIQDSNAEDTIDTDEDPHQGRSLRGGQDRALMRKRKREYEQEKKEKAEAEAKLPKQSKQFTKLVKDIQRKHDAIKECEDKVTTLDNDLREADCPRTRVLGKDRFWNRYYWFERNGMPYGGLPMSSTGHAGYANGCLWVQGPDDMEREGYIDMKPEWQNEYKAYFNMTVPERKKLEEGTTSLFNAHQWGYYEDAESLDGLIAWLDIRGNNELKLQKELKLYRDKIVTNMQNRKEYLADSSASPEDEHNKSVVSVSGGGSKQRGGPTTRRKEHAPSSRDHDAQYQSASAQQHHRCLNWHNSSALHQLGHRHIDQPRPRKQTKKAAAAAAAAAIVVAEEEEEVVERAQTRSDKKGGGKKGGKGKGEGLSRQGSRYSFGKD